MASPVFNMELACVSDIKRFSTDSFRILNPNVLFSHVFFISVAAGPVQPDKNSPDHRGDDPA